MSGRAIVIGSGIVGAACAMELKRAGFSLLVVDPAPIGSGATAAGMGHLVVIDEPAAEFELTRRSMDLWHGLAPQLDGACEFLRCGTLWVAADSEEYAEAERKYARMRAGNIASTLGDADWVKTLEPLIERELAGGLLVHDDAVVYAPAAARWMLARAGVGQVDVVRQEAIRLEPRCVVLADGSRLQADLIVNAAGLHAPKLSPVLRLRPRKGHLIITTRGGGVKRAVVELGYIKNAHGSVMESVAFNVQARPNGQVLIGSSRQFDNDDPRVEERMVRKMVERVREFMPRLVEKTALRVWTGFRAASGDGQPVIDWDPHCPGVILAAGHEGLGITTSLGTAELVAAMAMGRAGPIGREAFCATRFEMEKGGGRG